MIKAIIFDCFGVLTSDGWLPLKNKYFGDDATLFQKASELNKKVDSGLISYDEFTEKIGKMAGIAADEARRLIESNVNDEKILELVETLKPKYKIGMLSNAGADWLNRLFNERQRRLFDATALSYETGIVKPDPRAYEIIAARLKIKPHEAVFIDDQEKYAAGAEAVGMKFILYRDYPQLRTDLEKVLQSAPADNQTFL
jgi:HAD superfamily hydrolase (TIGR01509 family)